jgi:hypothetical protein
LDFWGSKKLEMRLKVAFTIANRESMKIFLAGNAPVEALPKRGDFA